MATVFWGAQGVIILDFLAKKSTVTAAYYANLLNQLRTVKNAEVNFGKGFCSNRTIRESTLAKLQWMLLSGMGMSYTAPRLFSGLSSYWLAPTDYFLFPNLKKDIRGCHFRSNEEVVAAVEEWVRDKYPGFFSSGLVALEHRWSMHHSRGQLHRKKKKSLSPRNNLGWFFIDSPS